MDRTKCFLLACALTLAPPPIITPQRSPKSHRGRPHRTATLLLANLYTTTPLPLSALFLFSLALFAFWLRSSVVSVLFSLISEILLRKKSMIKFIFVHSDGSSGLAHDPLHRVTGLTLPPVDANTFFIRVPSLFWGFGEEILGFCLLDQAGVWFCYLT